MPLADLLSPEYTAERRQLVGRRQRPATLIPGAPGGAEPRLPGFATAGFARQDGRRAGAPAATATGARRGGAAARSTDVSSPELGLGDTCHLDVADRSATW